MRRALMLTLLLAACSPDPVKYIPEADRRDLGPNPGTPITVDQLLARARLAEPNAASRMVVRFDGAVLTLTEAQRAELRKFAGGVAARKLLVSSRPGAFDDPGAPVAGQRRAIAVSRELTTAGGDVEMRFDQALPPGVVVVTQGMQP